VIVLLTIILLRPSVTKADLFHEIQETLNSTIRDPDEVGATAENVDCEGECCNLKYLRLLPTGWKLIQRRDEYGNPEDFFSSKLWND